MIALIAEDQVGMARLAGKLLAPICSEIVSVNSYASLFKNIFTRDSLHLASMDVFLADGNLRECREAIRYIRAKFPHCVIVIWSGRITPEEAEEFKRDGADGVIPKGDGFSVVCLYRLILESLSRHQSGNPKDCIAFAIRALEHLAEIKKAAA